MNKRIKELALKAYNNAGQGTPEALSSFMEVYSEKFAELIVRECIGITDNLVNRNLDGTWTSDELYTDYNGALFEVKRRIEEHFGVEA